MAKKFLLLFTIMIWSIVSSCGQQDVNMPSSNPNPIVVDTPTSTTQHILPTYTPTEVSTLTPLPPLVPTLLPKEKENYLLNMIKTNGGCKLPCFLGINPGISFWEEIREIEAPIYFREWYDPDKGDSISLYDASLGRNVVTLDVTFLGNKSVIERITAYTTINAADYTSDDYYSRFTEAMKQYSLPNILSEYRIPTRVLLQVQGQIEPESGTQAEILLFYDSLGIVFHYMFLDVVSQDGNTGVLTVCPNYEHVEFIRFYLQSPQNDTPLERMIGDESDYYLNSWLKPLEKITTLSVKDFYNLFVDVNEDACFDVP